MLSPVSKAKPKEVKEHNNYCTNNHFLTTTRTMMSLVVNQALLKKESWGVKMIHKHWIIALWIKILAYHGEAWGLDLKKKKSVKSLNISKFSSHFTFADYFSTNLREINLSTGIFTDLKLELVLFYWQIFSLLSSVHY